MKHTLLAMLFWTGLLLCGIAIARNWEEARSLFYGLTAFGIAGILVAMAAVWVLAVESWRIIVAAHSGHAIGFRVAARHLALLLLGKYLPGGVWGFLARLSDSANRRSLAPMLAAGICEQWMGLVAMSILGGIALFAAQTGQQEWVLLGFLTPLPMVLSLFIAYGLLRRSSRFMPARWRSLAAVVVPSRRLITGAAILNVMQQALLLLIVALVAGSTFLLEPTGAIAVAGSYAIAVVAGIAVVFMPGGILVREGVFVLLASRWLAPAEAIALAAGLRLMLTVFDLSAAVLAGGLHLVGSREAA